MPIDPVDEPLVEVAAIGAVVRDDPQYHAMGLPGARRGHASARVSPTGSTRVGDTLPDGITLIVWDGWRAFETQRALYDDWMAQLRAAHPAWDAATLDRETARFVSVPSADPACPAPHVTGGAVDLTLGDGDGAPLDLGTHFDAFVPEAGAVALEGVPGTAASFAAGCSGRWRTQGFTALCRGVVAL